MLWRWEQYEKFPVFCGFSSEGKGQLVPLCRVVKILIETPIFISLKILKTEYRATLITVKWRRNPVKKRVTEDCPQFCKISAQISDWLLASMCEAELQTALVRLSDLNRDFRCHPIAGDTVGKFKFSLINWLLKQTQSIILRGIQNNQESLKHIISNVQDTIQNYQTRRTGKHDPNSRE